MHPKPRLHPKRRSMKAGLIMAAALLALPLAAISAHASLIQLTSSSQLSPGDTTLSTFGTIGTTASSPLTYSAGGNTLTFADTGGTFEFDQAGTSYFNTAFPNGTNILYAAGGNGSAAPITLSFAKAITEIGFNAEEYADGPYTISFTAFDDALNLGTFTASGSDPVGGYPSILSFEGLRASGGTGITSLIISDSNGNNIGLGPVTFGGTATPVPEPDSLVLLGTGLLGLGLTIRRRKHAQ